MNTLITSTAAREIVSSPDALTVQKLTITKENRTTIQNTARTWKAVAQQKLDTSQGDKEREVFKSSILLNTLIANSLHPARYKKHCDGLYVVRDKNSGNTQAIALTKKHVLKTCNGEALGSYLKVVFLATNPINIRAACNDHEAHRTVGAGTCLITHLKATCQDRKLQGIFLEAVESAVPFYKKKGFSLYERSSFQLDAKWMHPMILPVKSSVDKD